MAHREAKILRFLAETDIPAPELVAVDGDGEVCDVPALLMTRLTGRVEFVPDDMASWLTQLASALSKIHRVDSGARSVVRPYRTYKDLRELGPPDWSHRRDTWGEALELLVGPAPDTPPGFIHRDYHPGNVLWSSGRLTAVVDWINASWGPAQVDVGHCRLNLATLHGEEIADRFLSTYLSVAGPDVEYHPYWDIITAVEWLPDTGIFPGWLDAGVVELTTELVRSRLDEHVAAAVARI